ncbi:MAG: exodeoxyribonuclease VII large subunit [Phascolarctobacterium sp.]|nr:exodeoxyribonuclease VII large subunit [Phascolarctobacterium sp.]
MNNTFTVSEINNYIKSVLDSDLQLRNVQVEGELSNFKRYPSGHCYFSLKDSGSVIKCVMFRFKAQSLRFEPRNGDKVVAVGRIAVYERDGAYQLYTDLLLEQGAGDLMQQYEALKAKLADEGLFAEERKQALPLHPRSVGIVTSSAGAAVRDIITVSRRRSPGIKLYLYPVLVQGKGASAEIARAIRFFNDKKLADILIVGRGGGSMEDLWAFNEERTVRAVAASKIPIISAVGHETDFTLCDFAADKRAATPSQAAELAVPDMGIILSQLLDLDNRARQAMERKLLTMEGALNNLKNNRLLRTPELIYQSQEEQLKRLVNSQFLRNPKRLYMAQAERLERLVNARVLREPERLYEAKAGKLEQLQGSWVFQNPERLFLEQEQRLDMAGAHLTEEMQQRKSETKHQLELVKAKLEAISPYAVFKRGYSCVRDEQQRIISSVEQVRWGEELRTSLADGQIISVVQEIERRVE